MRLRATVVVFALIGCGHATAPAAIDAATDATDDVLEADAPEPPDPCTGTVARIETFGDLDVGRYAPVGIALYDHRYAILAGYDFGKSAQKSVEILDPDGAKTAGADLLRPRNFAAIAQEGLDILVFGGFHPTLGSLPDVERWDPAGGTTVKVASMVVGREAHTATSVEPGVLVTGGLQARGFVFHDEVELFSEGKLTTLDRLAEKRAFHVALPRLYLAKMERKVLRVLLVGGDSGKGELSSIEVYDTTTRKLTVSKATLPRPSKAMAAAPVGLDRKLYLVAGGANAADKTLSDATIIDLDAEMVTKVAPMAVRRIAFTLTKLEDGRVLAIGGFSDDDGGGSTSVLELFDPKTSTWTTLPIKLAQPRHDHVALLMGSCQVLVAGGQTVIGAGTPSAPRKVERITIPPRG